MPDDLTPAQKQYWEMKQKHQDALLFFRMGDFYEMFGEDAKVASKVLGLTLTSRDKNSPNPVPMAGVPHHSVNKYIAQLSKQGYKVAICEQMSDPSLPGIVQREVVRVITPGTVVEDEMLEQGRNNFLVCIAEQNNVFGLSYVDSSTGDFCVTEIPSAQALQDQLFQLAPAEIIFPKNVFVSVDLVDFVKNYFHCSISFFELFEDPQELLLQHFQVKTLKGFGVDAFPTGTIAAGYLLAYLRENEKANLRHLTKLQPLHLEQYMHLDETTLRNLELLANNYDGKKEGSLLGVLDRTKTSMGARLLRQWIMRPLLQKDAIRQRHEAVAFLLANTPMREDLLQTLTKICDVERIVGKMVLKKAQPQDLLALAQTIQVLPQCIEHLAKSKADLLRYMLAAWENTILAPVQSLITTAIDPEARVLAENVKVIRTGYSAEIDELRRMVYEGKEWLLQYQQREQERTGIANLKVTYNKVFGYFIEVSKGQAAKVPPDFIRKQTLVNAERFITPELKEYEEKVLGAGDKLTALERQLFNQIIEEVLQSAKALQEMAYHLAVLDVLLSFATVAQDHHYAEPQLTTRKGVLDIQGGRHPVVESLLEEPFVVNSLHLETNQQRIMLLTGPNMAGKSTYLRQNALIILMAQIGSFVPAVSCMLDVFDRIFTRIGSADVLIKGQSTFLVEMQETANIINNATEKSFIILDEVGRGTSTYDGLSLAWSILEYLQHHTKAKVLFATHYHELIEVAEELPATFNASMAVTENTDGVVFLRKVVQGGVDKSYGIEVARISGLPSAVIDRAKDVLHILESKQSERQGPSPQLSFLEPQIIETVKIVRRDSEVEKKLSELDLERLTPLEALNMLWEMKRRIDKK